MGRYGRKRDWRLNIIHRIAPNLSLTAQNELADCTDEQFDKWAESKGVKIARCNPNEHPKLRGAELPQIHDWDMEEMNTTFAEAFAPIFEKLKDRR